jgi:receptor protein-tyrosine kinase
VSLIEKAVGKISQDVLAGKKRATDGALADDVRVEQVSLQRAQSGTGVPTNSAARSPTEQQLSAQTEPTLESAIPAQGMINLARLKQAGLITPDGERSQLAEEFRVIKRPLLMNAFGRGAARVANGNLIMVTSSLPGEGKSFCAVNLAMSIAMERDHTVLLIDADVAKPSVPRYLGLKTDRGLMDLLIDDSLQMSDVLIKTNVEKLTLLPAGRGHRYATELLASNAMDRLLDDVARRYPDRIIIFDSPPLLATSEARVLATHMGQIVMVVEAEKTTHEAVKEALKHIEGCEVVGMVLNKGKVAGGTDYYGYYGKNG